MGTRSLSPFQTTAPDSQDSPGIIAVELCGGEPVLLPSPGQQPPGRGVLAVPGTDSPLPLLPRSASTLLNRVPPSRPGC